MAEVATKKLPVRAIIVSTVALGIGMAIGAVAVGSNSTEQASTSTPQTTAAEPSGTSAGTSATTTTFGSDASPTELEASFDRPCGYGPLGEGEILAILADSDAYLAQYEEETAELVGCHLGDGFGALPVWSFDGRRAAWFADGQVQLWERATGTRGSVDHASARLVLPAPQGFAYWDDSEEEIVEASPVPEHFPIRTAVEATPDEWECDRREYAMCLSVGLAAVVDTGDYIFMRRGPTGSTAGPIWISRVTSSGDLWTYPTDDYEYPEGAGFFNILTEVDVDHDLGVVRLVTGTSCGTICRTPPYAVRTLDLATGESIESSYDLPPAPPERVWAVTDFDPETPAVITLRHQPANAVPAGVYPQSAEPELYVHDGEGWVRSGLVAHVADRSVGGVIALADTDRLYLYRGGDEFPGANDLIDHWEGGVSQLEWAPPINDEG